MRKLGNTTYNILLSRYQLLGKTRLLALITPSWGKFFHHNKSKKLVSEFSKKHNKKHTNNCCVVAFKMMLVLLVSDLDLWTIYFYYHWPLILQAMQLFGCRAYKTRSSNANVRAPTVASIHYFFCYTGAHISLKKVTC